MDYFHINRDSADEGSGFLGSPEGPTRSPQSAVSQPRCQFRKPDELAPPHIRCPSRVPKHHIRLVRME
jgi:hypothetical protein